MYVFSIYMSIVPKIVPSGVSAVVAYWYSEAKNTIVTSCNRDTIPISIVPSILYVNRDGDMPQMIQ